MKKIFFLTGILFACAEIRAQVPEDAKLYSWYQQNGTARNMAIGGAMGSLGGDLSALYVNPAGLGFYRTREFVFAPQFYLNSNKANFLNQQTSQKKNTFSVGTIGAVFGGGSDKPGKKSAAFAVGFTQVANLANNYYYKGLNNYSSYAETFAEEMAKPLPDGSTISAEDLLNTMSIMPYGAAPAFYTYLIDTIPINGATQIRAATENILDAGNAIQQEFRKQSKGGIYELAVGGAINTNDKWLFGGTLGIPVIDYTSETNVKETDTSSNKLNGFQSFDYTYKYRSTGIGVNLKLGAIFRPAEYFRVGLALHSPSFMFLSDEINSNLRTVLEDTSGNNEVFEVSSKQFTNGEPGKADYRQTAPWKAILSASYVFREVEDVTKQRGFITADIEYVNHKASRFGKFKTEDAAEVPKEYYDALNEVIKQQYKGTFNVRVGGEIKFNTIMGRLGFAYYGNPYASDNTLKARKMLLSGGLGYRNKGFFADLTYVHNMTKDAQYPYRLADRSNPYYASLKQTTGIVTGTIGWKF
ncbi:MAG: hypothetical protein WAT19_13980 [Ferruginibacter sp.]